MSNDQYIMHIINTIKQNLTQQDAELLIQHLSDYHIISNVESKEQELVSFQGFMLVLDTVSKPRTLDVPGLTFVLT